jgi:tetratricopeptide (TPR) repeat protein
MEDHRRIPNLQYRPMYLGLAMHELMTEKNNANAIATLDALEKQIPPDIFPIAYPYAAQIAQLYNQAGAADKAKKYAELALRDIDAIGDDWSTNRFAQSYNPVQVRAQMLTVLGRHDEAIAIFQTLQNQYPTDANLRMEIDNLRIDKFLSKNDTAGAIREIEKIIGEYGQANDPNMAGNVQQLQARMMQLRGGALPVDTARSGDTTR